MSVENNIAAARRWFDEIWNRGNFQVIHELAAPGVRSHGHEEEPIVGPDQFREFAQRIRTAFPDMQLTIDDIFGVEDRVVVRWSAVMTHLGDTLGLPATGRRPHQRHLHHPLPQRPSRRRPRLLGPRRPHATTHHRRRVVRLSSPCRKRSGAPS